MKKVFVPLIILSLILSGCTNFTDDSPKTENNRNNSGTIIVKGTLGLSGAVPKEIADAIYSSKSDTTPRSAIPSIPVDAKFIVTAECTGKDTVTKEAIYDNDSKKYLFEIGLPEGSWNITATLKTNPETPQETIVLKDTATRTLTSDDPVVSIPFYLKPLEEGTGNINLNFSYNSDKIDRIEYIPSAACKIEWENGTDSSESASLIKNGLKAGSYDITILFKKDDALVYSTSQIVNVFANMTTDKWVAGSGADPINTNGSFNVSEELITQFERTTFYVDSANGNAATGTGSPYSPLNSLAKAVCLANSFAETGPKKIFVKAGGSETLAASLEFSKDINVEVYTASVGDRTGQYTVTRSATSEDFTLQMVKINSGKTVSLAGIVIDGNNYEGTSQGMGIHSSGNLILTDCIVQNCISEENGGGIFIASGSAVIKGKTIIENNKLLDETINNIELNSDSTISVINTAAESHIGITKAFADEDDNTVLFASDTTADISAKYFSDAGYTIGNSSGKGCIARTKGSLDAGYYEEVKFNADETEFFVGEGTSTITFSAKIGNDTDPVELDAWNATVTYAGIDITNNVTKTASADKKSYKIVLPSTFPEGNYYIAVRGDYNGVTYGGNEIIKIEDSNVRRFNGTNIDSVNMSRYAGKTLEFILDSTVTASQLDSLCRKIDTSTATIDLDLSQVNNAENFRSTCYLRRHMRKIKLPNNLSEFNAYTQKNYYGLYIESVEIAEINPNFKTVDGVLFNKDMTELIYYPTQNPRKTYTVPTSVTKIGTSSFTSIQSNTLETLIFKSPVKIVNSSFFNARISHIIFQSTRPVTLEGCVFDQLYGIVDMTFYSSTPPTLSSAGGRAEFYFGTPVNFNKFYVPAGSKSAYVNDSTWNSSSTNNLVSSKPIDQWIEELAP